MSRSRFTYKITAVPGFQVSLFVDGVFQSERPHFYADSAEEQGKAWVEKQEADLAASLARHPANGPVRTGKHLRLVEPYTEEAA